MGEMAGKEEQERWRYLGRALLGERKRRENRKKIESRPTVDGPSSYHARTITISHNHHNHLFSQPDRVLPMPTLYFSFVICNPLSQLAHSRPLIF